MLKLKVLPDCWSVFDFDAGTVQNVDENDQPVGEPFPIPEHLMGLKDTPAYYEAEQARYESEKLEEEARAIARQDALDTLSIPFEAGAVSGTTIAAIRTSANQVIESLVTQQEAQRQAYLTLLGENNAP